MKTETDIERYTDLNPLTYDVVTYHMEWNFRNKYMSTNGFAFICFIVLVVVVDQYTSA